MMLINILGKTYPVTRTDNTIECCGIVIYKGAKDSVSLMLDQYKLFGIPVKEQIKLALEIKKIEKDLENAKLIDEEGYTYL